MMEFEDVLQNRRSIRKYTDEDVSTKDIKKLLRAAFHSPSASNRRPWHFIVVKDEEKKDELSTTHQWATMVKDAPVVIVVCADEEEADKWIEDASIAAEHVHLKATEMGLGSCWIQVRSDPVKKGEHEIKEREDYVSDLLNLPDKIRVLCMIAVGYPAEDKSPYESNQMMKERIHFNEYENGFDEV